MPDVESTEVTNYVHRQLRKIFSRFKMQKIKIGVLEMNAKESFLIKFITQSLQSTDVTALLQLLQQF